MITTINPSRLVRRISEALDVGGDDFVLSQMADDYAKLCKETAERVEQCAFLLERGDEFGAWKLASTPPDLLDLVAVLGFPREGDWRALCKERGFAMPSPFDEPSVARIGDLYSKTIDQSHPLYTAYRAAVRKRDDTAALFAINAIVRKNPDDQHARQEQIRLLAKRVAAQAVVLEAAVARGNAEEVCRFLELIESQGDSGGVNESLLARACALREEHFRNAALAEANGQIERLKMLNTQTETDAVGELVARITQAQEEFGFTLASADAAVLTGAREALVAAHREREVQRKHTAAIRALEGALVGVEEMLLRGDKSPAEMAAERAKLHRHWREVESSGRAIPEGLLGRLQKLNTRIDVSQKQKQLRRNMALGIVASVVIAGLIAVGVTLHRSSTEKQFVRQFTELRETGTVGEANALLELVNKDHSGLVQRPELAGAMNTTQQWIDDQAKQVERSETAIQELEQRMADFGAGSPLEKAIALPALLTEAEKIIAGLAKDTRLEKETRLVRLKTAYQEGQRAWAQAQQKQIESVLVAAEQALGRVEACRNHAEVAPQLTALVENNRLMEGLFKEVQAATTMPADQLGRAKAVRQGMEKWQRNATEWNDALYSLLSVNDYAAYGELLHKLTRLQPGSDPIIERARSIQAGWGQIDPARLHGAVLFGGNPEALAFVRANPAMKPEPTSFPAFPPEREIFNAMKAALPQKDVWQYKLISPKGSVLTLRSSDKPTGSDFPLPDGREVKIWSAKPIVRQSGVEFISEPAEYKGIFKGGKLVDGWAIEAVAFCPELDFIKRYIGDDGINPDNGRFTNSPVKILDALYATPDLSPTFVVYVEQEIFRILDFRPYNWGVHLSPTLQNYRAVFKAQLSRSVQASDWILPSQGRELEFMKLSEKRPRGSLVKEQDVNASLVREVLGGKIVWAGYVAADGTPFLAPWAENTLVFGLTSQGSVWRGFGRASTDIDFAPLSPLMGYSTSSGRTFDEILKEALGRYSTGEDKDKIKPIGLF
jgi:hypothetical protein